MAPVVKNLPGNAGNTIDMGSIPGSGRSLEEERATHSSILAWRIPRTEEPDGYSPWGHKELDTTECTFTLWMLVAVFGIILLFSLIKSNYLFVLMDILKTITVLITETLGYCFQFLPLLDVMLILFSFFHFFLEIPCFLFMSVYRNSEENQISILPMCSY